MENIVEKIWELITIYGLKVVAAIAVLIVGRWVAKGMTGFTEKVMNKRQVDPTIVTTFISIAKTGICDADGPAVHDALQRVQRCTGAAAEGEH